MKKQGQDKKLKIPSLYSKRAQEEMVGFALIIIIVAVIILIVISFTLTKPREEIGSYEIESFLQSLLQHTSDCEYNYEFLSIQKLISKCETNTKCLDERNTCDVLNEIVKDILDKAWKIENRPPQGYNFTIISGTEEMISLSKGNQTGNYKGAIQSYKGLEGLDVYFRVYYP